ncbi:hypothetical protein RRG08_005077 [Elysia crispata]|uniref:Uncharacterized protein n=1 Tax=Elysia crispata TaxID=231223 RepID=A0AAE1CPS0_9GAST|nr:hypothetical protein RRG08_005077 [Elysia crispata]
MRHTAPAQESTKALSHRKWKNKDTEDSRGGTFLFQKDTGQAAETEASEPQLPKALRCEAGAKYRQVNSSLQRQELANAVLPMKPIKRGFKLWVRADSNGYISKFSVY